MPSFPPQRLRAPLHTLRRALAVALAIGALVLAARPDRAPATGTTTGEVPVVVAAADLPAGRSLVEADLAVVQLPREVVPSGVATTPEELLGRTLAAAVRRRETLTDVRLVGAGLSALLPDGQVAAPVRLADLAVAGLVRTGDLIDVLATLPGAAAAETVAAQVRVLAAAEPAPTSVDGGLLLVAVDTSTAARLAAAATSGTLTVTLVPP